MRRIMAGVWPIGLVVVFLGILVSDAGTGDPYANQARILIQNGNLVLQSALNGNISLSSRTVMLNGVDIGRNAIATGQINGGFISALVDQRIRAQTNRISELSDQVNQLEENITTIANRVNQFVGNGRDKLSNRAVRRWMSKVQALTDKVNTLTQLLTENECNSNPCKNGGTCVDAYNGFICNCPSNWEGNTCETDVNECAQYAGTSFGCQNGATCLNTQGGYSCTCLTNWHGKDCTEKFDDCSTASHLALCDHGTCVDEQRVVPGQPKYRCICYPGWQKSSTSPACSVDIDECSGPNPRCSRNPLVQCINLPGSFHCGHCPAGYTGNGHSCSDINECEFQNGGCSIQPYVQCSNTLGSRTCGPCPAGYVGNGMQCTFLGVCSINRGGCHPLAQCIENSAITGTYRECRCPPGYIGNGEGLGGCVMATGMTCANNPCVHGTCQVVGESFHCVCQVGYHGTLCNQEEIRVCASNPCLNGGTCVRQGQSFTCVCPETHQGATCADRRSTSSCGGYLNSNNGTLTFPENGTHYGHSLNCAWVITVDPDKVVKILFEYFSLEHGADCEFDFLQLNDGPNAGSRVVGRFCSGYLRNAVYHSSHNQLYLWFSSDKSVASYGFQFNWWAVDPDCGGVLDEAEYGAVNSPGYPGAYPRNRTCEWLVQVPMGKRIQFHFATLRMENHPNCSYDYLKIFDGATDRDPEIGTYCTTVTPPPLTTSGHAARLLFQSDNSVQDTGFHITYSAQPTVQGCGGVLTSPSGNLKSPNFPDVYENNLQCEWLIRIHPDNRILLNFKEFNLETHTNCQFDHIELYDGDSDASPLLGRFCGSTLPPEIFSNSNKLFIKFRSDASLVHSGFKAEYKTICGGIFTQPSGILSSPYYPDYYPARAQCIYDIRLGQGYLVNITFHNMDIEEHMDCMFDYLQIRDGDTEESPEVAKLCGGTPPENIISTFNFLWIKFETDGSVQNRGFYAEYNAIEVGCGGVLTEMQGIVSSPRHPDKYPHSVVCSWHLRAPTGHLVRLTFTAFSLEGDTECRFDYVTVQDADGAQVGRFCGNQKPPILTSMDSSLFVKFVADASVAREGFSANYEFLNAEEACGGTFYQESGVIRSPGYPNRYPHSAHCVWILKGPNHRQITLNVTSFTLESHQNCKYDFLEIRNGGYETSPLIGKFCGEQILSSIKSHSNTLRLEFKTDASMSAPGFEIYFDSTATGCGGKLTSPRGTIVSPNYPQAYPYNADCEWLIQVSAGSVISLTVTDIDIEEHMECRFDYVQIFDGSSEQSKSLLRICNNQQNNGAVVSTGNSMLVRFRSDFSEVAGGFQLSYQTLCNTQITGKRSGVIESPNFPDPYPHNHNCTWSMEVPNGNNISFAFSHLFMEGGDNDTCNNDYVEIVQVDKWTGNTNTSLGKYCGSMSSPPSNVQTSAEKAFVRLVTDRSIAREGFRLEWRMIGCGGEIYDKQSGVIQSPNYPSGYPHKTTCYWHISYPPGYMVELRVTDLDMEAGSECRYDYLRVYGGQDEQAPRLLNLCSIISEPRVITSHGSHLVVKFNSDTTIGRRGFSAKFRKLGGGCGGLSEGTEGTLMSRNFPSPYDMNDVCLFLIRVPKNHLVVLDFYDFELPEAENCTKGYLAIYDGKNINSPLLAKLCGRKPEIAVSSTGNQMFLQLVADGINVAQGFRAHYHAGCGQRLLADAGGVITSMNYPHAPLTIMNCSWIIYASDPSEKVSLVVTNMRLPTYENCTYNSLKIMDGDMPDSPIISEFCGQRSPPTVVSRGSMLHVFLMNYGVFRATYGLASTHCGGDFNSVEGTFGSPGYPDNYDRDTECVWTVEASPGNKVHLSFESFNMEDSDHCNKDYVEIHEEDATGRLIGRYCGNRLPGNVTAARKLWIKFRSDEIETQAGFLAHYELQHGNVLNGTGGEIASPGYPNLYTPFGSSSYKWNIFVASQHFISIHFVELNLMSPSPSQECNTIRVQIHDGFDNTAPVIGQFCGMQLPTEPVISTSNVVFIQYFTTEYYPGSFLLQWREVTQSGIVIQNPEPNTANICWEEITLNTNESIGISSPNYPLTYPGELNCTYVVRAPYYQHVELSITDFETESTSNCMFDRLEVHYMSNPYVDDWYLNNTLCGRKNKTAFASPNNLMKLVFVTDKYVNFKGFNAMAKSTCGAHFNKRNGVVKSEFIYPDLSQDDRHTGFQCEYAVTVRPKRTIHIRWERFNVPSDGVCNTNYILLRNGGTSSSPVLGKFCGSVIPPALETGSNELFIQVVVTSVTVGVPDFELHYDELSFGCGGQVFLSAETPVAEITSPNYPHPPVHDTECEWVVVSPPGTKLRMDFDEEFHMSPDCMTGEHPEFLDIHDGGTELSPPLHRFCGHDQPSSVMSTDNALYAKYVTAVDAPQAGFKARVSIATCGGTVVAFHGTIASPNYPNDYGSSQECEWTLKMQLGYRILLNINDLDTPEPDPGTNCTSTDYLEIRDYDKEGEVLKIFCGKIGNASREISVPSSQAYVKFKSNSAVTGKGFSLWMQAILDEGCGGWIEGSEGVIRSPNFPFALAASRNCHWRMWAPEGRRMKLTFSEFNLPRDQTSGICLSYIRATNATSWRQEFNGPEICGSSLPAPIMSASGYINLVFFTHGLAAGQGFALSYNSEEESECGGVLTAPSGVIASPPNITVQSGAALDCRWRITQPDNPDGNNRTTVFRFDLIDLHGIMANYCRDGVLYIIGGKKYMGRFCGNYSSEVLFTSPYSSNSLRMFASQHKPMRGIHGTYNISNCGGVLSGNVEVSSPGYPAAYPPNTDCHWIINAGSGETVTVNFIDLRMEEDCTKDYVVVRNGYQYSSPTVGKFCGTHVPHPITSSSNVLSIIFHTDEYGSAPGFKFVTTDQQRGCGGLIHNTRGNLTSPGHPSHYENNVECRWVIEYPQGYVVGITFLGRFDLEMGTNCDKDYLMFEEFIANDNNWSQFKKVCGFTTPTDFKSSTNKVRITFHSNERITGDGFSMNYTAVCGGNFTQRRGEIASPNYPSTYEDNLSCVYYIGKKGQYVSLTFEDYFSIEGNEECKYDYINLFGDNSTDNTSPQQGPYCGTEVPYPRTLQGPVTLVFITDGTYMANGFKMKYEILDCGATLTDPTGVISTPITPLTNMNALDCTWQIVAPPNKVISLRFSHFDLTLRYRCWYNYLDVIDGYENATHIGRLCGTAPPVVKSTGNVLTLKLHLLSNTSPSGFTASYHTTYGFAQGCGGTVNASSGELQSLDFNSDGFYEPDLDCSWLVIGSSADSVFKVTFTRFDVEPANNGTCIYDYVEIRDNLSGESALVGRYCGSTLPPPIITSGNIMSVWFHSDDKNNRPGFKLKFESMPSACGPSTLNTGTDDLTRLVTSPNYPSPYPVNVRCRWTVFTNVSHAEWRTDLVQIEFRDFDVPCDGDYVEVMKGRSSIRAQPSSNSVKPIRLCGPNQAHDIIGERGMTITFHSDSKSNAARGFSFTYKDLNCNRTYTQESGVVSNAGYPGRRNNAQKCTMGITAQAGKTISAYFSRLELYDSQEGCPTNNLKIYDGGNNRAPLLGSYCGFDTPNPVFSSGNSLYIESNMRHYMGLFYLIYMTTDQGRGCGGSIYAEEGTISSPLFPQTYRTNSECTWYISVPGYHSVTLSFKRFQVNSTDGCDTNYVEIYDGQGATANRVARYCGTDVPATHISQGNEVMVKFKTDTTNHGTGFLIDFQSNNYLSDTNLPLIQRHPDDQTTNRANGDVIYLT